MTTKYREKFKNEFIDLRAGGQTIHEIAYRWKVSRYTIFSWRRERPDFAEIYARGEDAFLAWLAIQGRSNFDNPKFNERIYNRWAIYFARLSDKEPVLEISGFSQAKTYEEKTVIITKLIEEGRITATQYETLQRGLNLQFEREQGQKVIEAADYIKEKEKEGNP